MVRFFVWLAITAAIHPLLAIIHVVGEIVWLLVLMAADERARNRPRHPLT